jgi:hypothetical protein
MATFYKYKEREDISKSMIDWSGITKEISDNLMKEKTRRDDLKLKIEEDQLEKLKAMDEYAKGLDPTMNQAMLEYAQNYKDYLLNSHKLMKNGLVSVNDTKIKKQGAMDTFNALNDVTKVYNEKIGAFLETGGSLNEFVAGNVAGALDIRKSQLMIDDMGRGSFVTLDENGNEVIVPVTSINTILNDKYDRFDTTGEVVNTVKSIADWTLTSQGGYKSVSDFRQRGTEFYEKTLRSKVDGILNSDKKIVEAAADMMGMKVTYDEKLVKENPDKYILAKNQGGKIIFDVDKKKVKDRLYNEIDAAIGRTEKQTPYRPSSTKGKSYAQGKSEDEASALYNLSNRAAMGDSVAFDQIEGRLYSITDEKGTKKQVKLSRPIKTSDGNILINDVNGNEVINIPSGPESALAIANIIRSGESADKVQSMFEEGEKLSQGKLPKLRGGVEEGVELVSSLNDLPVDEDKAEAWLKNNLPSDIEVSIPTNPFADSIRLTKGQDSKTFDTDDIDGIKAWLDKYNATPMVAGEKKSAKGKRTIQQIIKEDGVSRAEAINIFNKQ